MILNFLQQLPAALRIAVIAIGWVILVGGMHFFLNGERPPANHVLMGYMPVITNLAAPVVDYATRAANVRFEALKFGSFAEMSEAFRSGHIQAAFIIAPLAVALHQQGVPLKVVYIGNRHESTLVQRKDLQCRSLSEMRGKTVAVPIRYSGHLLAVKRYLREQGMDPECIRLVEIPPPDMPAALSTGGIDGYFVGEPFASKALVSGIATRLVDVEAIWPKFICNLMIVRDDLVRDHPDWVQTLVTASVWSGFWARDHIEDAVALATRYWGQDPKVVSYAFEHPPGRVRFDLYTPAVEEMEQVAEEMRSAGLLDGRPDLSAMVEDRFARAVKVEKVSSVDKVLVQ